MKVGILTYHHTTNYGATLQTFALYHYLKEKGVDISVIDYRPLSARITYFKANYLSLHPISNFKKQRKFSAFVKKNLSLTYVEEHSLKGLEKVAGKFDMIISGSDEIWNFDSFRGFDKAYFLGFGPKNLKRVSYAASFGQAHNFEKNKIELKELLFGFNKIAVRDSYSNRKVKELTSIEPKLVLDPTFLIDYSQIKFKGKIPTGNYILAYGRMNDSQNKEITEFSIKHKLPIYSIGYFNKSASKNLIASGIEEWIDFMRNASFIYTNFYHGFLFSIIFNKHFKIFSSESKKNKVNDILDRLSIKSDYSDEFSSDTEIKLNFHVEKQLKDSKNYLNSLFN